MLRALPSQLPAAPVLREHPTETFSNPEPMNIASAWGLGSGGGEASWTCTPFRKSESQPLWGPSLLAGWLAGSSPPGAAEAGEYCSQWYQRYNHLGLQVLVGLEITHI